MCVAFSNVEFPADEFRIKESDSFEERLPIAGWISLVDLESGHRWACRVEAKQNILNGQDLLDLICIKKADDVCKYLQKVQDVFLEWNMVFWPSPIWQVGNGNGMRAWVRMPMTFLDPMLGGSKRTCIFRTFLWKILAGRWTAGFGEQGWFCQLDFSKTASLLAKAPTSEADYAPSTPRASLVVLPASKDSIGKELISQDDWKSLSQHDCDLAVSQHMLDIYIGQDG